jgi:hypothetical protein
MSRWWRAYDEAVDDPKLCLLTDKQHRAWFNLCCITSQNDGKLPPIAAVAFKLRMTVDKAKSIVAELVALGLIDNDDGVFAPHNWGGRQYKTDVTDPTTAIRSKRYRDKKRDVDRDGTVSPTVSVTDTRAETEQITETEQSRETRAKRATRLPNDWVPSENDLAFATSKGLAVRQIETEALKFLNYWTSKSGQGATKTDWSKTWQNWILTATQGVPTNGRRTVQDAARDLHENLLDRIAAFDEPAPRGLRDGTGSDVVRLLPARGCE